MVKDEHNHYNNDDGNNNDEDYNWETPRATLCVNGGNYNYRKKNFIQLIIGIMIMITLNNYGRVLIYSN